jgi:hypothetical protein
MARRPPTRAAAAIGKRPADRFLQRAVIVIATARNRGPSTICVENSGSAIECPAPADRQAHTLFLL